MKAKHVAGWVLSGVLVAPGVLAQDVEGVPVEELELITPKPESEPASVEVQPDPAKLAEEIHADFTAALRQEAAIYAAIGVGFGQFLTLGSEPQKLSGAGLSTNLFVGAFLSPRWVIGGGLAGLFIPNGNTKIDGTAPNLSPTVNQAVLGPFVMVYPWDSNGIFFFGMLGAAGVFVASATVEADKVPYSVDTVSQFGIGEAVGVGLDWTSSSGVGFSAMARLAATQVFDQPKDVALQTALVPGLTLNLVYY